MTSAAPASDVPRRSRETSIRVAAGLLILIVLLVGGGAWVAALDGAIPDAAVTGNVGWGADARLILYILAWVSHALRDGAAAMFDPPVGFPARGVLTGSEHLLSAQLAFTPVVLATRNVVLAANVTTLTSYWLAAFVPFLLLRRHSFGFVPAFAAGVVNACGPLQVPADFHQLQVPAWCVPLVLLAADRTERSRGAALAFAAALVITTLMSYQAAANVLLATGLLLAWTVAAPSGDRGRRAAAYVFGATAAAMILLAVSWPYVQRLREPGQVAVTPAPLGPDSSALMVRIAAASIDPWWLALAFAGVAAALLVPRVRPVALRGAVLAGVGAVLACGWSVALGDLVVPLPYALFATLPGSAAVQPTRFLLLTTTGLALLAGCALDAVGDRLGSGRVGMVFTAALATLVTAHGIASFTPPAISSLPFGERAPQVYRWLAAHPGGAVLDLRGAYPQHLGLYVDVATGMLGSLVHGHPVLGVHSHYDPPAAALVRRLTDGRPSEQTLQALVEMTHLRWIVLPPRAPDVPEGPWLQMRGVTLVAGYDDGRVFEVRRDARFAWFAALSAGPRQGQSLLGTALAPVAGPRAEVTLASAARSVTTGSVVPITVRVVNQGVAPWPVAVVPGTAPSVVVRVEARWQGANGFAQSIALPWDVEPGETTEVRAHLTTPSTPGAYTLDAVVRQGDTTFPAPSSPVEIDVR